MVFAGAGDELVQVGDGVVFGEGVGEAGEQFAVRVDEVVVQVNEHDSGGAVCGGGTWRGECGHGGRRMWSGGMEERVA